MSWALTMRDVFEGIYAAHLVEDAAVLLHRTTFCGEKPHSGLGNYVKPINPPESIAFGACGNLNGLHLRGFAVLYGTFLFSTDLSHSL